LSAIAQVLPAAALTQSLQAAMTNGSAFPTFPFIVLVVWAILILLVAIRTFKWE
jgi:ABC-2 type transport system permease protein